MAIVKDMEVFSEHSRSGASAAGNRSLTRTRRREYNQAPSARKAYCVYRVGGGAGQFVCAGGAACEDWPPEGGAGQLV
jgi:hypothetical protein